MNSTASFDHIISMDCFYAPADRDISYLWVTRLSAIKRELSILFSLSINTSAIMLRFQSLIPRDDEKIVFFSNRLLQTQSDFLDEFQPSVWTTRKCLIGFIDTRNSQISSLHQSLISLTSVKCNE